MITKVLEEIGLSKSEIKVYIALLKLGESKKDAIVKEAKIASSKIYEVTSKLIDRGLASVIVKNRIKHFRAAPPERLNEVINQKREILEERESELKKIIPLLQKPSSEKTKQDIAEMYVGWRGLETLYYILLNALKKGDKDYVIGASPGIKNERTEIFYTKINRRLKEKNVKLYILFGKNQKEYAERVSKRGGLKYSGVGFLDFSFPTEINIVKDYVATIIFGEEPVALLIKSKVLAENYVAYFNALCKIAKKEN